MTDTTVVTSCSRTGWDSYGARFVDGFLQYWPPEIRLLVVSEDELPTLNYGSRLISHLHLTEQSILAREFLARHSAHGWAKGDAGAPRPPGLGARWPANAGGECFRFDAYKFSKKVFAITLAAERTPAGRLLWLDADVVTFALVPLSLPDVVLPQSVAISCLARPGYHSECGFVGYNLDHSACRRFINAFANLYASDEVFKLSEWHDSWVFDYLRHQMKVPAYELPHRSKSHPFINSELGKYLDHCKGKRKKHGRSIAVEQLVHRTIPYWQRSK